MTRHRPTSSATIAALALLLAAPARAQEPHHPEKPTYDYEKCYGVARAARNDCFTASSSCGSTATVDAQPDAWIYLPAGTCDKIAGGSRVPQRKPAG